MGIDLEYSIQIKKDGELDYLPYLIKQEEG